jgi:hypothetical protein
LSRTESVTGDTITIKFKEGAAITSSGWQPELVIDLNAVEQQYLNTHSFVVNRQGNFPNVSAKKAIQKQWDENLSFKELIPAYETDSCNVNTIDFPVNGSNVSYYVEGCGGPFVGGYTFEGEGYGIELIYYKKGNLTGGTPFVTSTSPLVNSRLSVKIAPMPCTSFADLYFDEADFAGSLVLHDLFGRVVDTKTITEATLKHHYQFPEHLAAGAYFMRLSSQKGTSQCLKIIKE